MKTRIILPFLLVIALAWGCSTSQRRATYNSFATVGMTTDAAVKSYLDLLVKGQVSTNSFPVIIRDYQTFQVAFNLALSAAQFSTNAAAPPDVIQLSGVVLSDVAVAKGGAQ